MSTFGKFYRHVLYRYPLLVQSVQAGVLMGVGDLMAQKIIEKRRKFNYLRTAQFFTMGTVVVGPALTVWYRFLSRRFGNYGRSTAVKKMAVDQLVFAPSFLIVFVVALNLLQGRNLDYAKRELRHKYKDILITNYKIWPAVQLCNFYLTPLSYQVLVVQFVALIWNAYLSWKTQQGVKEY